MCRCSPCSLLFQMRPDCKGSGQNCMHTNDDRGDRGKYQRQDREICKIELVRATYVEICASLFCSSICASGTFVLPTRAGNASGQISIYICVCQYTVAANIQWQWSEATALTLPRPPRHLYHHQCHSLTSRQISTFPLSPPEEDKKHFPIFFVLNLRSFRASLCLTPVCSHYCSPRFMGLAFSYTLYKCAFPNITLAPMYLITVNLPAFLNFA